MTQIANARRFDGVDDRIQFSEGLLDTGGSAGFSWLAILKSNAPSGANNSSRQFMSLRGSASGEWSFGIANVSGGVANQDSLAAYVVVSGGSAGATGESAAGYLTSAMGWCLVAVTKASGIATPRWHRYRYDTQAWDHTDDNETHGDPDDSGGAASFYIGAYDGTAEFFSGDIAVVGVWKSKILTDGQLEGMTSGLSTWMARSPTSLWMLNQSDVGTAVSDQMGNSNQTAITGTTAVSVSDLAFDAEAYGPLRSQVLDYDYSR